MRRRPLVFIWVEGLVARVTALSSGIDEGRAAAERLAESRGLAGVGYLVYEKCK